MEPESPKGGHERSGDGDSTKETERDHDRGIQEVCDEHVGCQSGYHLSDSDREHLPLIQSSEVEYLVHQDDEKLVARPFCAVIKPSGEIETDEIGDSRNDAIRNLSHHNRDDKRKLRVHIGATLADKNHPRDVVSGFHMRHN